MVQLKEREIAAIERALNTASVTEAVVKVEQGKVVVLAAKRKRIL